MNLTESIVPRSDQTNAEDLLAGPITVTIEKVVAGTAEQPVEVHTVEMPGRPYKPSKSMRRVMVVAWGAEASAYIGRRLTLVRNPEITFGRDKVGGIEISHLSDIDKPITIALTVTRGKRRNFSVAPLPPARDWLAELTTAGDNLDAVYALGVAAKQASAPTEIRDTIRAHYDQLKAATA
jgi:hypothetical protein